MTAKNTRTGRPIWLHNDGRTVQIIDQRQLPHKHVIVDLTTVDNVIDAIQNMLVRGAPLIGATGAFGAFLAALNTAQGDFKKEFLQECDRLKQARPTAVNLAWGVDRVSQASLADGAAGADQADCVDKARREALAIADEEAENCKKIGQFGLPLIEDIRRAKKTGPVNILTHCNAGWLACIEYGTATAPIYAAFDNNIDIHVWVDETRPLNQGARLTAWELGRYGIPHTVITDNAGGHLMQHGLVDMVLVGTDRTTYTGDVANKIGTYLKALAARDNDLPFYVALPSSTFDWEIEDGLRQIPIEERDPDEVRYIQGLADNKLETVLLVPEDSPAANYAFDVTPARLVTGFITERGVCRADRESVWELFPEKRPG